jgi:hypothetical protein
MKEEMMESAENLYCKIFIDTDVSDEVVVQRISSLASGEIDQWSVVTEWGEIDIVDNDDFDDLKREEKPDGFLFYRYYIEMEPEGDVHRNEYVNNVSGLLEGLWKEGWKAVAACDFESELPRGGGYGM